LLQRGAQLQFLPQTLATSPTQTLSQEVVQQQGSAAQICEVQVLQVLGRAEPVEQSERGHEPAQTRLLHTDATSLTQSASQPVVQQNGSTAQMLDTHELQLLSSGPPVVHRSWGQANLSST
jgi:hypothetical protein